MVVFFLRREMQIIKSWPDLFLNKMTFWLKKASRDTLVHGVSLSAIFPK